jgi:hypothetical protein
MLSNGVVGCCPFGSSCQGTVNAAQVTTIIVTKYVTSTPYPKSTTTTSIVPNRYCSTLVAHGPNLPTTAQGVCGTILIISGADMRPIGWKLPVLITGFYGTLGLYSFFRFRW